MVGVINHKERSHARFAPSSMERTEQCPGWLRLADKLLGGGATAASNQGTAAHELIERCLTTRASPGEFEGFVVDVRETGEDRISDLNSADGFNAFEVDAEMMAGVQIHLDTVEIEADGGGEISVEQRLDLSHIHPDCYGTGDVVIYHPVPQRLIVLDYKNGRKPVEVRDNIQLSTYAVGAAKRLHNRGLAGGVTLIIVQPNAYHADGPVRRYNFHADAIASLETRLRRVIAATEKPDAALKSGEWCHFCPAMAECPTHALALGEAAGIDLAAVTTGEVHLPVVTTLSTDQLGAVYANAGRMEAWIKAAKRICTDAAIGGRVPTGLKLVHSRRTRRFANQVEAAATLDVLGLAEADYTVSKMVTPAALEKRLGKPLAAEMMKGLLDDRAPSLTLAPMSDPRPPAAALGSALTAVSEE